GDRRGYTLELSLRRLQQRLALACSLRRKRRVAAGDETLAGEVGRGDLGQIALVEQGRLQRSLVLGERGGLRSPETADPVEPGGLQLFRDTRRCDHATVPDHGNVRQPEPPPQLVDLLSHRLRICGIALKHLYCYRRAIPRAQQSIDDLQTVRAMVATVAVLGKWAASPLHVAR